MKEEHRQFLKEQCNHLLYGKCCNLGCMRRGGHKKGDVVDYNKATCPAFEIYNILEGEQK